MSEPAPSTFETFGSLLRHLRHRARLTQRELGIAVGYSEAHIARLESNQRKPNWAAVSSQFIEALQVDDAAEWATKLIELAGGKPAQEINQPEPPHPAEAALTNTPTNLRAQLTPFIGRAADVAHVQKLLGNTRLLTLTGMGGMGKSRLAAEVASTVITDFVDGVWMCPLAGLEEGNQVVPWLTSVLAIPAQHEPNPLNQLTQPDKPSDPLEALKNYLQYRQALLVLDGCEPVVDAAAALVLRLLQSCPHLTILATSREPLSVPGEMTWRVPPLNCDEAIALFQNHARAVWPEFEVTEAAQPLYKRICERCEGLPLAIELAASRLRVLSLDEIVARLDDPLSLLTDGSRVALPKHQSLRALIDWSYDRLTHPEQTLFRRLSALSGQWTLEQAEALFDDQAHDAAIKRADVLHLVSQLVKKSLLETDVRDGMSYYRMMELVRQYAQTRSDKTEKVEPNEATPITERTHLAF